MAIIEMLRREGCSGATAMRGIAGFGASSLIHTAAILRLSMDLPIVISVVDRSERIDRIIAPLRAMAPHALITAQELEVVQAGAPFREGLPDVRVGDVMRCEVVSVHPDGPLSQVIELLLDKGFTALPVVDE
jgi:PII-like signaling protein